MAHQNKKQKVDSECRKFQTSWETEYFFTKVKGKCICLIYSETVAVMKKYNVRWHFQTKHKQYESCTGAEQEQKVKQMAATLQAQQKCFRHANKQQNATAASYEVALLIAQYGKPFTDGTFIKQCLAKVAGIMCPEKLQDIKNVSLSRNTVVHCMKDLSANMKHQVSHKACAFEFYSIACDESADATDTAQLLIFLQGVENNFCITKELLDLRSLKGKTMGKDIFEAVSDAIDRMGLIWDKLCGLIELQQWQAKKRERHLWCVPKHNKMEVKLLNCTVLSTKSLCHNSTA